MQQFAAVQQTNIAELPPIFERFQTEEHILRVNTVENKIPNVNDIVKKTDFDIKILDIQSNYFVTSNYNKFTNEIVNARKKEKDLVNKFDILGFLDLQMTLIPIKDSNINNKNSIKSKFK